MRQVISSDSNLNRTHPPQDTAGVVNSLSEEITWQYHCSRAGLKLGCGFPDAELVSPESPPLPVPPYK